LPWIDIHHCAPEASVRPIDLEMYMNEIKCPHCGQSFTIDEAGYSAVFPTVGRPSDN